MWSKDDRERAARSNGEKPMNTDDPGRLVPHHGSGGGDNLAVLAKRRIEREAGMREKVIRLLWEKQFEGSPWAGKFHLIRPESLEADYGPLADKIIETVTAELKECYQFVDRRQPGVSTITP